MTGKKRYVHITLDKDDFRGGMVTDIDDAIAEFRLHFSEGSVGEVMQLRIVEMTEEEQMALPEFEGW